MAKRNLTKAELVNGMISNVKSYHGKGVRHSEIENMSVKMLIAYTHLDFKEEYA